MSASPNQLDEIHKQLKAHFLSHPVISITPTKGDPPEQYEIIYTLSGFCKTGEGKIVESVGHKVELAIPFGFPHFPPSCKPKCDIFHPDFDPVAICLGDFWRQDRSLSDLIIHIGQMINGEFYSTNNAFNEEAAAWYLKNKVKFPLARISWQVSNDTPPPADDTRLHLKDDTFIDTLDEGDLNTEFDFLALENKKEDDDITLNTAFPEVNSSSVIDLELFNRLDRRKKYFTLLKSCEGLGDSSEAAKKLCLKASDTIELVEKLHTDAKKFEKKGEARIAFEKYQQITTIVTDFPNIDSDIHRIKQTLSPQDDIHPEKGGESFDPYASAESSPSDNSPAPREKKKNAKNLERTTPATKNQQDGVFAKKRHTKKIFFLLFLAVLAVSMGGSGYFWYAAKNTLREARTASAECSASLADNQFKTAERLCTQALHLTEQIRFIHQTETQQLQQSLRQTLQSEKLTHGLAGNILHNGKYIPESEVKKILLIQQQIIEANALFHDEKWPAAEQLFTTILAQIDNSTFLEREDADDMRHKRLIAEFRMSYDPAQVAMRNSQWEDAIEKLFHAQKVLMSLPETEREQYSAQLQEALQKSQFANLKEQGDLSFTGADWLSAIAAYNLALTRGQDAALSPESIDAIRNNIKRAELYTTINRGNKAFASGAWDDAIAAYNQASNFLSETRSISGTADSDINIAKLSRIILQASIIRDRQTAQTHMENDELSKARGMYQQILENIAASSLRTEEEFKRTEDEINTAIKTLDEDLFLTEKTEYLKNNYQALFAANYSSAIPENLINPVISNTKKIESKYIFRMQCTETGGGRPLTLVMFYAYDKKTGKWSLYSES
jgi:ubiquitin-protein ligase